MKYNGKLSRNRNMRSIAAKMILLATLGAAVPVQAYRIDPAAAAALRQVGDAQSQISRAFDNLWRSFESSSDYQQALADVRQTRGDFEQTRTQALAEWHETVQYKSDQLQIWKLQQQLDDNRDHPEKIAELAEQLLRTRCELSQTESYLLSNDEKMKSARYAMLDAQAKTIALRHNFIESIRSDPQWRSAHRQLEQAVRVASTTR
jgi:hypothetical protein